MESQRIVNAAATLVASSPVKEGEQVPDDSDVVTTMPSMAAISRELGFSKSTGRRKLMEGSKRRKLIHDGDEFVLVNAKNGYQKVSNEIRDQVQKSSTIRLIYPSFKSSAIRLRPTLPYCNDVFRPGRFPSQLVPVVLVIIEIHHRPARIGRNKSRV